MNLPMSFNAFIPLMSLVLYLGGVGFYWLMAFFILYHLIRFGIGTQPKQISFIFLLGSIILTLIVTILFVNLNFSSFTKPLLNP